MASRRGCANSPDRFCYVCGQYTLKTSQKSITDFIKKCYLAYFKIPLGEQDKVWAPHKICNICYTNLREWTLGKRSMSFGVPMVWREPSNHATDCYFCLTRTKGFNSKNKHSVQYPTVPSAILPVPHCDDLPVPTFVGLPDDEILQQSFHAPMNVSETPPVDSSDTEVESVHGVDDLNDDDFDSSQLNANSSTSKEPECFNQNELNDLVRDLNLSKESSELLASRLNEKCLLTNDTRVTYYRTRDREFRPFFEMGDSFVSCTDINGLLCRLGVESYNPIDWRLFIDSSKRSLKCVLLHNGNCYSSVPLAHSVHAKENYDAVKKCLSLIKYDMNR